MLLFNFHTQFESGWFSGYIYSIYFALTLLDILSFFFSCLEYQLQMAGAGTQTEGDRSVHACCSGQAFHHAPLETDMEPGFSTSADMCEE